MVLGEAGYILHWLYHTKLNSKGPIELDIKWTKKPYCLNKTELLFLPFYSVSRSMEALNTASGWIISSHRQGFYDCFVNTAYGSSGTIRQHGENSKGFNPDFFTLKKDFGDSIQWGKLWESADANDVYSFAWKDQSSANQEY